MVTVTIKLPDVGEGVAEAELVAWHVAIGDQVREDQLIAEVMTDKATVEIPSSVEGAVSWLGAGVGDTIAVGSPLVKLAVGETGRTAPAAVETPAPAAAVRAADVAHAPQPAAVAVAAASDVFDDDQPAAAPASGKALAAPAVRARAKDLGVDLAAVAGSGPEGRVTHADLDRHLAGGARDVAVRSSAPASPAALDDTVREISVVGLRRQIAQRMAAAHAAIPHITYVEEVDVTAVEDLRASLNEDRQADQPKLTLLPFLVQALVRAIEAQPHLNAHFDDEAGVIRQYAGVHVGMAAQTSKGLMVPVIRHAEARDIWACADEAKRLAAAARDGRCRREELTGSTITITSLGALGGVVSTPIINAPEVAILGVNKREVRPVWDGSQFQPRMMMNLSSSFDHRVIDGWDAATFIQTIKRLIEAPARLFI